MFSFSNVTDFTFVYDVLDEFLKIRVIIKFFELKCEFVYTRV